MGTNTSSNLLKAEKKRARQSSGMPPLALQFIVFTSGILLTLCAYVIMGHFVQTLTEKDHAYLEQESKFFISDQLKKLEYSVLSQSIMVSGFQPSEQETIQTYVANRFDRKIQNFPEFNNAFTGFFWVPANVQSPIQTLYQRPDQAEWSVSALSSFASLLRDTVTARVAVENRDIVYIADFPGSRAYIKDNGTQVRPIIFVHPTKMNTGEEGFFTAIAELDIVLNHWIDRQAGLSGLQLLYKDKPNPHLLFRHLSTDQTNANIISRKFDLVLGGLNVEGVFYMAAKQDKALLYEIPFLLIFFGFGLTLIGTIYVRNNQKQAEKMAIMNKALAQKNYDMNSQVRESERLYKVIRKAERENKAIINAVSDIIFETDRFGAFVFLNKAWESVTHIPCEDVHGSSLFDYVQEQDRDQQKEMFIQLVKGKKQSYRSVTKLVTADGVLRSVELGMSMIRHDENKNIHVIGTIIDIEDRQRAERALNEAESKYQTIIENTAGGIYQLSPQGRYLSANPAMAKILGYRNVETLMANVGDINAELYRDPRKRLRFLRDIEDFRNTQTMEFQIKRADGQDIWVQESARVVFNDDESVRFYEGSLEDITTRKKTEMELREAKVQSDLASRAKSEFLTNMSHELRTPLNSVIGFSEIIKNQAFGPVGSGEYLEYAQTIYDSGQKLLNIINDILDVSRIETGDRVINEGLVNLKKVAVNCIDIMQPRIEEHRVTVTNMIPDIFPDLIGEELAVKQMILNLLSNAVKFNQPDGRITISSEITDSGNIRLSITDTGQGLSEDEIEKALSPFGQVDNQHKRSNSGTGLGLTLVDSLVKLHQGTLELFSQKGIGTTATLVFPAKRVARRNNKAAERSVIPFQTGA